MDSEDNVLPGLLRLGELMRLENEILSIRKEAFAYTCHGLLEGKYAARILPTFDKEEKELFLQAKREMDEALRSLDELLAQVPSLKLRADLLGAVNGILWNGQALARWAPPIAGNAKAIEMAAAKKQAFAARAVKLEKSAKSSSELRAAIERAANGVGLVNSSAFAESIHDEVHKILGATGKKWPSTRTIQRQISAILGNRPAGAILAAWGVEVVAV